MIENLRVKLTARKPTNSFRGFIRAHSSPHGIHRLTSLDSRCELKRIISEVPMKLMILALACCFFSKISKADTGLSGRWIGPGFFSNSQVSTAIDASFTLEIVNLPNHLTLKECMTPAASAPLKPNCLTTDYEINENNQIFSKNKKVGDIFPERIQILQSNSQVSEQILIQFNELHQVSYQYIIVDLDGGSEVRKALLQ